MTELYKEVYDQWLYFLLICDIIRKHPDIDIRRKSFDDLTYEEWKSGAFSALVEVGYITP
jgi:hypothetical protein